MSLIKKKDVENLFIAGISIAKHFNANGALDDKIKTYRECLEAIEDLPTIEEQNQGKHGYWIWSDWFYRKNAKVPCRQVNCSLCNGFMDVYEGEKAKAFCGDCGAKMDQEVAE